MKIHHIGYAVRNIDISAGEFERFGYKKYLNTVEDTLRGVFIQFMEKDGYLIELIAPLSGKSHIWGILKKTGSSPYHICYEVENVDASIEMLLGNGYILVEKPCTAPAIDNRKAAFLYNKDIGILELLGGGT